MTKTVLVIEDDPVNMRLAEACLTLGGYTILKATTGVEGFEEACTNHPDIILLDWELPNGVSGASVIEWIRADQDPRVARTPIIVVSAHAQESFKNEVIDAGADGYLSKPYKREGLLALISELTKR